MTHKAKGVRARTHECVTPRTATLPSAHVRTKAGKKHCWLKVESGASGRRRRRRGTEVRREILRLPDGLARVIRNCKAHVSVAGNKFPSEELRENHLASAKVIRPALITFEVNHTRNDRRERLPAAAGALRAVHRTAGIIFHRAGAVAGFAGRGAIQSCPAHATAREIHALADAGHDQYDHQKQRFEGTGGQIWVSVTDGGGSFRQVPTV